MNTLAKSLARSGLLFLFVGALMALPAQAVERVLKIQAPAKAAANAEVKVTVRASTDAGADEKIGFLHVECSVDGGQTWTGLCYEQNQGASAARVLSVTTGAAGSKTLLRARVAYRGGAAGDVDFKGGAIKWEGSWKQWDEPPARVATIEVGAR